MFFFLKRCNRRYALQNEKKTSLRQVGYQALQDTRSDVPGVKVPDKLHVDVKSSGRVILCNELQSLCSWIWASNPRRAVRQPEKPSGINVINDNSEIYCAFPGHLLMWLQGFKMLMCQ